jgi:hypothetical protein
MEPVVVRVAPQNWIRMAQAERECGATRKLRLKLELEY